MKLKSLLFGSAAVLAAGTGAQAADLPIAEPVEYVRICDAFGTGYYYIPGTDTCLRVYGRVRVESHYVNGDDFVTPGGTAAFNTIFNSPTPIPGFAVTPGTGGSFVFANSLFPVVYADEEREFNNWTSRARGYIRLDARTQTDFGLVRAFVDTQFTVGPSDFALDYSGTGTNLNFAFIQVTNDWGTYTAGHNSSFFDFWGSNTFGTRVGIDDNTTEQNLFAWTLGIGNGISATLSIEDPQSSGRRVNAGQAFATFTDGPLEDFPFGSVPGFDGYEGQEAPDLVGNIRIDQGWGSAQIMGVVRHIHDEDNFEGGFPLSSLGFPAEPPAGTDEASDGSDIAFAVGAGLNLNLPFFGLGFNSQAGYSEGAIRYVTSDPASRSYFGGLSSGDFLGPDAESNLTEAWVVRAGLTGDFTETIGFSIDGSYTEVDAAAEVFDPLPGAVGALDNPVVIEGLDYNHQAIVGNVTWTPVPGLLFGWEAGWNHLEIENSFNQRLALSGGATAEDDFDVYGTMFRVQRDF